MDTVNRFDNIWSCYVCLVSFIIGLFCFGIHNSYGIIYVAIVRQFKTQSVESAWLGSLAFGATFFFSPFSSVLCDMIPPSLVSFSGLLLCIFGLLLSSFATDISVLYLTYGLCFGIGASFTYFPTVIVLKKYFKRYLNLANGISASGSGLGTLVLGPLIEHSLECFGLHWMFRLCALAAALLIIVQMMFIYVERKFKSDIEVFNQDNFVKQLQKNICGKDLWSNRQYQIMIMSMAIFLFGYFVPYVHLTFMATTKGIPTSKATFLISYLSISSVLGKIFFGLMINFFKFQVHRVTAVSMFSIGIANCLVPFGNEYVLFCLYAVACGVFEGCINGQIAVIVLDTVGSSRMAQGLANLFAINAAFMMAGPAVTGFIFDQTNSYEVAFIISGCSNLVGAILMLVLSCSNSRSRKWFRDQVSFNDIEEKADKNMTRCMLKRTFENDTSILDNHENKQNLPLIIRETCV